MQAQTERASAQASAETTHLSACACLPVAIKSSTALHVDMANKCHVGTAPQHVVPEAIWL